MKKYTHHQSLILESKAHIENLVIAYDTFGVLNKKRDNVIWVFHAISGHSDVMSWWTGIFGSQKIYDPAKYFIVCANSIGSPYGSSKPNNTEFPYFTIRDVAKAHLILADHLGIDKIHTLIGGSFGGYQALEFAYSFRGTVDHQILLASSSRESAWGIAIHESQRMALQADASFGKQDSGVEGMKAARAIAMLTYRTSDDLIQTQTDHEGAIDNFKASSYMNYQGNKFSKSFDALCFYYLTKCIDSHNIGRGRGGEIAALRSIKIPTLVIGFTTDTLVPIRFQKFMAEHIPNAIFNEIDSDYGHDGFLKESDKISSCIDSFYRQSSSKISSKRVVMKFGGSSLYGREQLERVLSIVKNENQRGVIALVVSARGKTTDKLIKLFDLAKKGLDFDKGYQSLIEYLTKDELGEGISKDLENLEAVLKAVKLLRDDSEFAYDRVIAFGEILSAKSITLWLTKNGLKAKYLDARNLIYTDSLLGEYEVNIEKSRSATQAVFSALGEDIIPVVTGFIASSEENKTVTLGRNGSNYTASLLANFIQAKEVQNWTDIDGVYSSNPHAVSNSIKIDAMTYKEANEMANFGMNLLHPKTILPLIQSKIPLIIKCSRQPTALGTRIDQAGGPSGIKAVTTIEEVSLVIIEGDDLSQKIGIDARLFTCLSKAKINIKMISQASSERGIGFVIHNDDATYAELLLNEEFKDELRLQQISSIRINNQVGIVAIIGRHNFALEKAISTLRKNGIWMHLISNSISGEHISLVVSSQHLDKAVNLVHNEVFGVIKTIPIFAFGKGKVGAELIRQIHETSVEIIQARGVDVKVIGIADSKRCFIDANGLSSNWKEQLSASEKSYTIHKLITELKSLYLNDIVIVDNTSSQEITDHYELFVENNFNIVASNKKFNSGDFQAYHTLRNRLLHKTKSFYYEANVGAGLPIINLLSSLRSSSDVVTKIRGVFSGSLSYIFNNYSVKDVAFTSVLSEAMQAGLTEPDPREDMNGLDVARKLVILAREINYQSDISNVQVENLIPAELQSIKEVSEFLERQTQINEYYQSIKNQLKKDEVLRYVAELDVKSASMSVSLKPVSNKTPLGQIKNADTLFEVYTESYKDQPIIIQGAGAGPTVTARAVYSDILKIKG